MSTKLIFRSGLKTIGGTIVELIKNEERIIFDFGTFYDPANRDNEVFPQVEGIYDGSSEYEDHVLISHLHLDHTKAMNKVDKNTKIYMLNDAKKFLELLYEVDFKGFVGDKREYCGLESKEMLKLKNFDITFLDVDHDVIGSSSILIETSDLTLLYSGDIRLHGMNSNKTYEMIEYIKNLDKKVDVAIFEGVTISFIDDDFVVIPSNETKPEQCEINFTTEITKKLSRDGLILVNPYIMSLERLQSILKLGESLNKKVCLTSEFAKIADKYFKEYDFMVLGENKFDVLREVIDYDSLNDNHLAIFNFANRDKYLSVANGATLVQTGGEPLGAFDPNWTTLQSFCEDNGIDFIAYGASGHGTPENILYIVEEINPSILIPLHSFKPELLKSSKESIKQLLPVTNKIYYFESHKLI